MERKRQEAKHEFHAILEELHRMTASLVEDTKTVAGHHNTKRFMEDYADFIKQHEEREAKEKEDIIINVEEALDIKKTGYNNLLPLF